MANGAAKLIRVGYPKQLGLLDNPGPVPLFQLTDGQFRPSTNGARRRACNSLMARGGRKTPPPPNCSPIVTRIDSNDNIPLQTITTSNDDPRITVEPATPNPTGGDIQEIVCQSLIRTHSALARLRQPNHLLDRKSVV